MASMSLRRPSFKALVRPAERLAIAECRRPHVHSEAILELLGELAERWSAPPVEVSIEEALPAHTGFGSKTTTLLSLGRAYAELCGASYDAGEVARVARRAGTSGASVNLLDRGGFLVDGGHANPPDFGEDPQRYLVPSRFAGAARKPPVLINMPFPPWPILVIVGNGTELSGDPELRWFRETLPIPAEEARRTAHHVLMHIAPAVAEGDYRAFCHALNTLTYEHHYKQEQIAVQSDEIKALFEEARELDPVDAIGLSVTGPMCFAFSRRPREATAWAEDLVARGLARAWWWSCAQNHPLVLEGVPN